MDLSSSINIIYHTSPEQKRFSKDSARQYKYGSPKIRDVLREKCRQRIKEARRSNFDGSRNGGQNENLLEKILREEVNEIEKELDLQELIFKEMLVESHEWFIEEDENQQNYFINLMQNDKIVFCPICKKCELTTCNDATNQLICECGIRFHYNGSLTDFLQIIQNCVKFHGDQCDQDMVFFIDPSTNEHLILIGFCGFCDYYYPFK